MKTLPRIVDDRVSLVLTPQAYHNYDPATDIFNHSAYAYWSMMVPGEDAWGHIVCTGGTLPLPSALCLCFSGLCPVIAFQLCHLLFSQGYSTCWGQLARLTQLQSFNRNNDDFPRRFGASFACCIHC